MSKKTTNDDLRALIEKRSAETLIDYQNIAKSIRSIATNSEATLEEYKSIVKAVGIIDFRLQSIETALGLRYIPPLPDDDGLGEVAPKWRHQS